YMAPAGSLPGIFVNGMQVARVHRLNDKLRDVERGARRDLLLSTLNPDGWVRLTAAGQYFLHLQAQESLRHQQWDEQLRMSAGLEALNPVWRESLEQVAVIRERIAEEREHNDPVQANPFYAPADYRRQAADLTDDAEMEKFMNRVMEWSILVL